MKIGKKPVCLLWHRYTNMPEGIALSGSLLLIYAFLCPFNNFLPLFLGKNGYSNFQLGLVMAIIPVAGMLGQFVFGNVADKMKNKVTLLLLIALFSSLFVCVFLIPMNFLSMCLLTAVFVLAFSSISPLADMVVIDRCQHTNMKFGRLRLCGTIGYLVATPLIGYLVGLHINAIFFLTLGFGLIYAFFVGATRPIKGYRSKNESFHLGSFLKRPQTILILLACAVIGLAYGFTVSYLPLYMTETLGASASTYGIYLTLISLAEIPVLLFYDKLIQRFSLKSIVVVCLFLTTLRWLGIAFTNQVWVILVLALVQGVQHICMFYAFNFYLSKTTPKSGLSTAIMILNIVYSGVSKAVGSLLGDFFLTAFGGFPAVFLFFAILTAVVAVVFLLVPRKTFS